MQGNKESGAPNAYWQAALASGEFLIQRSRSSGEHVFPPRWMAPGSGSDDLDWVAASGQGSVYSVTWVTPRPPAEPYNVALIALDEGPHMMSRVTGVREAELAIGMRVRAHIVRSESGPVIEFVSAEG